MPVRPGVRRGQPPAVPVRRKVRKEKEKERVRMSLATRLRILNLRSSTGKLARSVVLARSVAGGRRSTTRMMMMLTMTCVGSARSQQSGLFRRLADISSAAPGGLAAVFVGLLQVV